MEENEKFCPVLISTLCRHEHFKVSIEALKRCTHAKDTDLFIALDYPFKDSHVEGYNKIKDYIETISGFKNVYVIKRETNYGSARNVKEAFFQIFEKYDCNIYLEDDNEVSPNFLEFINKGLKKFDQDQSVYAICGYTFYDDIPHDDNNFYRQNLGLAVWGYGVSKKRYFEYEKTFTHSYCIKKILNPVTVFKAIHHSWSTFFFLLLKVMNPKLCTDNTFSIYMLFEGKDVIMPIVSKVKNNGYDGTGEHCGLDDNYAKRSIDQSTGFDYRGTGFEHHAEIESKLLEGKRQYITFSIMCGHIYRMIKHRLKKLFGIK